MSDALRAYQASRQASVVEALRSAMATIDRELAEHGAYPRNNGRLTRNELCRRAGVGQSTLKNGSHAQTLVEIRSWLARVAPKTPKADGGKRVATIQQKYVALASEFHRFKVMYEELVDRCASLEKENVELRRGTLKVVPHSSRAKRGDAGGRASS